MFKLRCDEILIKRFEQTGYETPEHNTYFRMSAFTDKGDIIITNQRFFFDGRSKQINIEKSEIIKIREISIIGVEAVYVSILYKIGNDMQETLFLGKGAVFPLWAIKSRTKELYKFLKRWCDQSK